MNRMGRQLGSFSSLRNANPDTTELHDPHHILYVAISWRPVCLSCLIAINSQSSYMAFHPPLRTPAAVMLSTDDKRLQQCSNAAQSLLKRTQEVTGGRTSPH